MGSVQTTIAIAFRLVRLRLVEKKSKKNQKNQKKNQGEARRPEAEG
jgi:hypothetical protein